MFKGKKERNIDYLDEVKSQEEDEGLKSTQKIENNNFCVLICNTRNLRGLSAMWGKFKFQFEFPNS